MAGAMRGLADGLDPDSAYLDTSQVQAVEAGTPLAGGDVGIELTRQFYLRVIAARDGSPAAKAGLQTGDYVRGIDGKPTRDMSVFEGMRLLRGEPGSKVRLTIIRGNAADPHDLVLVREKIPGTQVSSRMLAGGVGYVRIATFRSGAADEVRKQVGSLKKAGATSLLLDVRRTAEGSVDDAVAAARLFVKSGTLTTRTSRASVKNEGTSSSLFPQPTKGAGGSASTGEAIMAREGDGEITLPDPGPRQQWHLGCGGGLRGRARRQQAGGARRRAHTRPRRGPEAREAPRKSRPLAHLRQATWRPAAKRSMARA